jgi:hypothetical protein
MRTIIVLICCGITLGCSESIDPIYYQFVNKFANTDFSTFKGYGIYSRGFDENGLRRFYVAKAISTNPNRMSGNIEFLIDSNNCIRSINTKHLHYQLNIDSIKTIVLKFHFMSVSSIGCDYDGNVRFTLLSVNSPDLIKSYTGILPENAKGKWKRINSNWFVRIR